MAYPFYPAGADFPGYGQQPVHPQYHQAGPSYGNGYGYQMPQARPIPPPIVNPQEAFRSFYQQQLVALTWNSRPIIQNLTILAQERRDRNDWASCSSVAMEIELAIDKASPSSKLPLLYLVDSISKNVGAPYTSNYFPHMLAATFLRAYSAVDGVTKTKMEEMLGTWRTGGPGGTDLFANGVREAIERGIYGGQQSFAEASGYGESMLTQEAVIDQLARALQAKRHILARDPQNPEAQLHTGVLQQIQKLLHTQALAQPDLQSIAQQLATINASDASDPAISSGQQNFPSPYNQHQPLHAHQHPLDRAENSSSGSQTPNPVQPLPFAATQSQLQPAHVAPAKIDFGGLFKNLAAAGVISHSSTPNAYAGTPLSRGGGTPDARSEREGSVASDSSARDVGRVTHMEAEVEEEDGLVEYEDMILAMNVSLTIVDLEATRGFDLTAHLPNRCSQCSARFPAGKLGRSRLQAHLDWHFRRNRRERESEGRGGHRRWLPKADFWINDILASTVRDDLEVPENATSSTGTHARANNPAATAVIRLQQMRELQAQWVVVPADPAKAALPCPICKEKFASEFNEAEEEWIWKNAVLVDGQIYHATCRADAMSSAIANRKLAEKGKNTPRAASPAGSDRMSAKAGSGGAMTNANAAMAPSPLKPKPRAEKNESSAVAIDVQVKQEAPDEDEADGVASSQDFSAATAATILTESLKRKATNEVDAEKVVKKEK